MSKRSGDTSERILSIARELFGSRGYTGTSIADIATELGTHPGRAVLPFPFQGRHLERAGRRTPGSVRKTR
ncbi:TetR/AcrR family transcriptional regulator [Fodinicola feengrottensis]|uniref:TetR/AcrR family transcriptional regulator n=1 Tax=Fodinicola feengrottensis TaxID=435914 RepID=UPI002442F986|nr:TetR/AcrR family transcriptional regulator [Fodinicola feengrottensis]